MGIALGKMEGGANASRGWQIVRWNRSGRARVEVSGWLADDWPLLHALRNTQHMSRVSSQPRPLSPPRWSVLSSHFIDQETKAQGGRVSYPRSQREEGTESGFALSQPACRPHVCAIRQFCPAGYGMLGLAVRTLFLSEGKLREVLCRGVPWPAVELRTPESWVRGLWLRACTG